MTTGALSSKGLGTVGLGFIHLVERNTKFMVGGQEAIDADHMDSTVGELCECDANKIGVFSSTRTIDEKMSNVGSSVSTCSDSQRLP